MTRRLTSFFATFAALGGITGATPLFAQETKPSTPPRQTEGMMGDQSGMKNMMGGMMQMAKMMENCNRMMENRGKAPAPGDKSGTPTKP